MLQSRSGRIRAFLILALLAASAHAAAQTPGQSVSDPERGIRFTAPAGWTFQKTDGGFVLGQAEAGRAILFLYHRLSTLEELMAEASAGLSDEGIVLEIDGATGRFGEAGIAAAYGGHINGEPARGYAVGLLAPEGGGVTVVGLEPADRDPGTLRGHVEEVARSVRFSETSAASQVSAWKRELAGARLLYLTGYTSGSSGGYNARREIQRCGDGSFSLRGESSVSIDVPGASGSSADTESADGRWSVSAGLGEVVLTLTDRDGGVYRYALVESGGKVLLDGTPYLVDREGVACP